MEFRLIPVEEKKGKKEKIKDNSLKYYWCSDGIMRTIEEIQELKERGKKVSIISVRRNFKK